MSLCMEFEQVNSKRVYGLGLGLRSRHSAMTRISGKSFSPQYQKLLHGPLNFTNNTLQQKNKLVSATSMPKFLDHLPP